MEGDVMPNHCYFQKILLQLNPSQTKVKPYLKLNLPNFLSLLREAFKKETGNSLVSCRGDTSV